ncbi:MAG TPA: putative Fe-S cluster assembly protein SufT [Terracidiphilus sp.]|jgi:probable FeS assembly SUF system protein SufT|nr:putative Fe-S cluster assembly protein SufT [Terracidiphilus sp.]
METVELKRDCEAVAIPSGLRQTLPQGTSVRIVQARGGSYTVSTKITAMYRIDGKDADALGFDTTGAADQPKQQGSFREQLVWDALKTVYDPELPVNIVDLGLVYSCSFASNPQGGRTVIVQMAVTSPGCGMSNVLKSDVESKLLRLPEVSEARVEVVFDPPWNPSRMSEAARLQLGMDIEGTPSLVQISPNR